jgi:hypothetical protein
MVTGYTTNKLDIVKTFSRSQPYILGVNGVNNITYSDPINLTGITSVSYIIDDVSYTTRLSDLQTIFSVNGTGNDFEPYLNQQNGQNTFDIKEEYKMNLVFPPKVTNDLFIERMELAVFEKHSRLSGIKNLENLEIYRNGYYQVIKK